MNEHWQLFHNECELHILRHYANIGQKVTKYYSGNINRIIIFKRYINSNNLIITYIESVD